MSADKAQPTLEQTKSADGVAEVLPQPTAADQKQALGAHLDQVNKTGQNYLPTVTLDFGSDSPKASKPIDGADPKGEPKVAKPDFDGATEVVKDAQGRDTKIPLKELSAGDHTIELKDGRQFLMHVPQTDGKTSLPVMFVFSGSAHPKYDPKNFADESGMNRFADSPDHKFIAVYPLPLKHRLGAGDIHEAYAWNAPGSLIKDADRKQAGYDDTDYVKSIVNMLPQLAKVDATHKDWGAVGWSQGAAFLNSLVSREANLFPTLGLVGGTMQNDFKYDIKPGNGENVDIVQLHGDKTTLPFPEWASEAWKYKASEALRHIVGESVLDRIDDLEAIQNQNQNPRRQEEVYEALLGHYKKESQTLATPAAAGDADKGKDKHKDKDRVTVFKSTDPGNDRTVVVTDLAEAQHSYPEPDPSGARTNATLKYTEFDTTAQIVALFNSYNDKVHHSQIQE